MTFYITTCPIDPSRMLINMIENSIASCLELLESDNASFFFLAFSLVSILYAIAYLSIFNAQSTFAVAIRPSVDDP